MASSDGPEEAPDVAFRCRRVEAGRRGTSPFGGARRAVEQSDAEETASAIEAEGRRALLLPGDVTVRATLGAGHGSIVSVSGGKS